MAKVVQKTKEAKLRAAQGGKNKKKSWTKKSNRDTKILSPFFTNDNLKKLDELSKRSLVTPSIVSQLCNVNLSAARAAIRTLVEEGKLVHENGSTCNRDMLHAGAAYLQKKAEEQQKLIEKNAIAQSDLGVAGEVEAVAE